MKSRTWLRLDAPLPVFPAANYLPSSAYICFSTAKDDDDDGEAAKLATPDEVDEAVEVVLPTYSCHGHRQSHHLHLATQPGCPQHHLHRHPHSHAHFGLFSGGHEYFTNVVQLTMF